MNTKYLYIDFEFTKTPEMCFAINSNEYFLVYTPGPFMKNFFRGTGSFPFVSNSRASGRRKNTDFIPLSSALCLLTYSDYFIGKDTQTLHSLPNPEKTLHYWSIRLIIFLSRTIEELTV